MKITISATLTEDEINILSSAKGYEKTIISYEDVEIPYEAYTMGDVEYPAGVSTSKEAVEKKNPQSPADFIRQVYEGIIIADATKIFTDFRSLELQEQQRQLAEQVRESVVSSINSTIE